MPTNALTEETLLRALPPIINRKLQEKLDAGDGWEKLAVHIPEDNNAIFTMSPEDINFKPRYTASHLDSFRRAGDKRGGSSTKSLMTHWGSYNPSVKHLYRVLHQAELIDAANLIGAYIVPPTISCPPQEDLAAQQLRNVAPAESAHGEVMRPPMVLPIQVSEASEDAGTGIAEGVSYHSGHSSKESPVNDEPPVSDEKSKVLDDQYPDEKKENDQTPTPHMPDFTKLQKIDLDILRRITNNFNDNHIEEHKQGRLIGKGGFGNVYLGTFQNGHQVAIKRLKDTSDDSLELFKTEVETLSTYKHQNVVLLLGYSVAGATRCLVYPYLAQGSLEERLAQRWGTAPLAPHTRVSILAGTGRGVSFLNFHGVVHRDLKTANILLDQEFVPKIGDFATAKVLNTDTLKTTLSMMSSKVIGTAPYLPPEALTFRVTDKWDTFSFGVVVLEVLTGLPVLDSDREFQDLKHHVQEHLYVPEDDEEDEEENPPGTIFDLLDNSGGPWGQQLTLDLHNLAQRCLENNYKRRPKVKDILPKLEAFVCSVSESAC